MKTTALTLTATAVALAAAAALLPSLPAQAAEPTAASTSTASASTYLPAGDWGIKTTVRANDGLSLRMTHWTPSAGDAGYGPGDVAPGQSTVDFVTSDRYTHGVTSDAVFQIVDRGVATGYYVQAHATDAGVARQADSCQVFLGDPLATGTAAAVAPYSCATTDLGGGTLGSTWFLRFDIGRTVATTITDPADQAQFLKGCTAANCAYIASSQTFSDGDERPYGLPVTNTGDIASSTQLGSKTVVSNSTSFGLSINTSAGFGDVFSIGVDSSYTRTWETSTEFDQTYDVTVPAHGTSWLTVKTPMVTVTGDFYVLSKGVVYLLPHTTATLPNAQAQTTSHIYEYTRTPGGAAVKQTIK